MGLRVPAVESDSSFQPQFEERLWKETFCAGSSWVSAQEILQHPYFHLNPKFVGWQSYILNQTPLTPNLHFQLPAGSLHQRAFSNCVQNPALLTTTISALPNGTFILLAANSKAFLFPSPHPVSCDLPATVGQALLTTTCLVLAVAPYHCSGAVHLLCPSLPVWSTHNGCDQVLRDFHCLLN